MLEALGTFFGSFLPAYAEGCAPDGAALPYITYELTVPDALEESPLIARVWYQGRGYLEIAAALDAIGAAIGPGACLPAAGGTVWLYKEARFVQFMPVEGDDRVKCACLSMKLAAIA